MPRLLSVPPRLWVWASEVSRSSECRVGVVQVPGFRNEGQGRSPKNTAQSPKARTLQSPRRPLKAHRGDVFSSFPFEGILGLAFPSLSFGGIEPFFETLGLATSDRKAQRALCFYAAYVTSERFIPECGELVIYCCCSVFGQEARTRKRGHGSEEKTKEHIASSLRNIGTKKARARAPGARFSTIVVCTLRPMRSSLLAASARSLGAQNTRAPSGPFVARNSFESDTRPLNIHRNPKVFATV